jgi:RNA polymerase sigma factor (sigma-70 family)
MNFMGTVVPLASRSADPSPVHQRFHEGDEDAFEAVAARHVDDLYTFCLRVSGRREDAWDLAQDTLVRARAKHHLFDPRRPLRPWLLTIAHNLWRSRLRSPWTRLRSALADWMPGPSGAPAADVVLDGDDRDRKVRHALSTLPPIYREAIALFHLEDMTYAEMQAVTSVSVSALKQRVRRGDALLAEKIANLYPELVPERKEER